MLLTIAQCCSAHFIVTSFVPESTNWPVNPGIWTAVILNQSAVPGLLIFLSGWSHSLRVGSIWSSSDSGEQCFINNSHYLILNSSHNTMSDLAMTLTIQTTVDLNYIILSNIFPSDMKFAFLTHWDQTLSKGCFPICNEWFVISCPILLCY